MILNEGRGNGQQLLKPETVAEMGRNNTGDVRVAPLGTTNPARLLKAGFFPGLPKSWGLSLVINEEPAPTGRPAGSLAWAGIYNTFSWIDPRTEIGGVFMSQLLPFVDTKATKPSTTSRRLRAGERRGASASPDPVPPSAMAPAARAM